MRKPTRVAAWVVVGIVLLVGTPDSAIAQRFSLSPTIGLFIPTAEFYKAATSGNTADLRKQEVSIGLGGRLGIRGKRVGVEFTGVYAPSKLKFTLAGEQSTEDANVFTGSGRLTLFVLPTTSLLWFAINGGVGVVHRSGAAYGALTDRTDLAPTAGAQLGFRLGRLVAFTISAEGYAYRPDFNSADESGSGQSQITQKDIHLSAGVSIPFLGLGR
ncbi:MAG: hypothetical protein H0U85_00965 [Gemmatimonadales bacterium]|nr:hypothetical protein [Gemmatimonadales bacterium]